MKTLRELLIAATMIVASTPAMATDAVKVDDLYVASNTPVRHVNDEADSPAIHPAKVTLFELEKLQRDLLELDFTSYCTLNGHDREDPTQAGTIYPCIKGHGYRAVQLDGGRLGLFRRSGNAMIPLEAFVTNKRDTRKLIDFEDIRASFSLPPMEFEKSSTGS
jgi:hypothetical protein